MNQQNQEGSIQDYAKMNINQISPITKRGGAMYVLVSPATLQSKNHILGYARLKSKEIIEEHLHDYGEESLYVLSGEAVLTIDENHILNIREGDAVLIPKGLHHKIENKSSRDCEIIFASAPLAPNPSIGHRETKNIEEKSVINVPLLDEVKYVEVEKDVFLFCRLTGLDKKTCPILLLHGNRDNHSHFSELQAILSTKHPVIAVDFRGHGLSSKLDDSFSVEKMVADLIKVIDYFNWKKVILVGHSLGASTTLNFSISYPELLEKVVLMGAAAHYEMKWKRPPVSEDTYPNVIRESNKRAANFFFREEHPDVRERVIRSWSSIEYRVHKNLIQLTHPDTRNLLHTIKVPTLIIAGEEDKSTTVKDAEMLLKNIPNSKLAIIPKTGHFMFMENSQLTGSEILKFLEGN